MIINRQTITKPPIVAELLLPFSQSTQFLDASSNKINTSFPNLVPIIDTNIYKWSEYGASIRSDNSGSGGSGVVLLNTRTCYSDVVPLNSDFTIDFWFRVNSFASDGYSIPILQLGSDAWATNGFILMLYSCNRSWCISGTKKIWLRNRQSGASILINNKNILSQTWYYCVVCRESGYFKLSIDGSPFATSSILAYNTGQMNLQFVIGGGYFHWIQGRTVWFSDFRVRSGANHYENGIIIPTTPIYLE